MLEPLVSVIIPNYCHAKYLDQRIQSVLNQTYRNFEVIILDDCSPDNGASQAVIEKYRNNPHVSHIVYNTTNSGSTFKQWNKGLKMAVGTVIWIAESDDYCEPDFLERLIACWNNYPTCSVVTSALRDVDEKGGDTIYPNRRFSGNAVFSNGKDFIKWNLVQSGFSIPNASAVLFKRDTALNVSDDYISYKAAGDRLFWIYMLENGDYCHVDNPLSYFRHHAVKVTNKREADGTQARENYRIHLYLKKKGYIKGIVAIEEFRYYWDEFHRICYNTNSVRQEILHLWFPWWKRNFLYRLYVSSCYFLYGKVYLLYNLLKSAIIKDNES